MALEDVNKVYYYTLIYRDLYDRRKNYIIIVNILLVNFKILGVTMGVTVLSSLFVPVDNNIKLFDGFEDNFLEW
jgi:hypothetical protein